MPHLCLGPQAAGLRAGRDDRGRHADDRYPVSQAARALGLLRRPRVRGPASPRAADARRALPDRMVHGRHRHDRDDTGLHSHPRDLRGRPALDRPDPYSNDRDDPCLSTGRALFRPHRRA